MDMKSNIIALVVLMTMLACTGCETSGTSRINGANVERHIVHFKHVTIEGDLTIGGAVQDTDDSAQEGLGVAAKNDVNAEVEADGNTVTTP